MQALPPQRRKRPANVQRYPLRLRQTDLCFKREEVFLHRQEYALHTETTYPRHGTDCESCDVKGTYNVPDHSKSLSGVLSASSTTENCDRNIGSVPYYETGPASRACGACHGSQLINEDAASELDSFNQYRHVHLQLGGGQARG